MKKIPLLLALLMLGLMFLGTTYFPVVGDPYSPAATHVSPRYLEKGYEETGSPNIVTAVLADYRAYDTLGETLVILTAGLVTLALLKGNSSAQKTKGDKSKQ